MTTATGAAPEDVPRGPDDPSGATGPTDAPGPWATAASDPRVAAASAVTRVLRELEVLGTVTSTQDELARLADPHAGPGVAPGTVLIAEQQTAGRGRRGRAWVDDARPGASLALSLLLEPSHDARRTGLVPLALGLGVQRAIASLDRSMAQRVRLKWPNDVLVRDTRDAPRKVAGLLVERTLIAGRDLLVAGVGINVDQRHLDRSAGDDAQRTSVAELLRTASPERSEPSERSEQPAPVDVHAPLLAAVLLQLDAALVLLAEDPDALLDRYRRHSDTLGRTVRVERPGRPPLVAVVEHVDRSGHLVVLTPIGRETVVAGTLRDADR